MAFDPFDPIGTLEDAWEATINDIRKAAKEIAGAIGFKEQDIYQYFYAASRLVPDADVPTNTRLVSEMIKAISYGTPLSDVIRVETISGTTVTLGSYMRYGRDTYINGLPTFGFKSPPDHQDSFASIVSLTLAALDYTPNVADSSSLYSITIPTPYDLCLAYLQADHGYTYYKTIGGFDYVLYDTHIEVYTLAEQEAGAVNVFEARLVRYATADTPIYETVVLSIPTATQYKEYYQYKNIVTDTSGNVFPFVYLLPFNYNGESNEHPELIVSPVENSIADEDLTQMMPIVAFKRDGVNIVEGNAAYATSVALMRKMNLDFDDIQHNINYIPGATSEDPDVTNPDAALAYDMFFLFGATIYSDLPETKTYFYRFFRLMWEVMAKDSYAKDVASMAKSPITPDASRHSFFIEEANYNATIIFRYIHREYISGTVGTGAEVGDTVRIFDIRSDIPYKIGTTTNGSDVPVDEYGYINDSRLIYRRQINATTYEQLTIAGLKLLTYIHNVAENKDWGNIQVLVPESEDTGRFLIPLSYKFLNLFGINNVERVIYESMNLVFFGYDSAHLEYWETEEFAGFVVLVITVVALYFGITNITTGYAAATSAGGIGATAFWQGVFVNFALAYGFKIMIARTDLSDSQKLALTIVYIYLTAKIGSIDVTAKQGLVDTIVLSISTISEAVTISSKAQLDEEQKRAEEDAASYKTKMEANEDIADGLLIDADVDMLDMVVNRPPDFEYVEQFVSRKTMRDTAAIAQNYADTYVSTFLDSNRLMAS